MRASLALEAFGDNVDQELRFWRNMTNSMVPGFGDLTFGYSKPSYWAAEITGFDPKYKYQRQFLRGKKDYKKSNSKGSRGIFVYYLLESGHIYEVLKPISWKRSHRYFCTVNDEGEIIELDKEFVDQWIKDRLESMS